MWSLISGRVTIILSAISPVINNVKCNGEFILTEKNRTESIRINTDSSEKITDVIPAETNLRPYNVNVYAIKGSKMLVEYAIIDFGLNGNFYG